jgi:hypothetical protein
MPKLYTIPMPALIACVLISACGTAVQAPGVVAGDGGVVTPGVDASVAFDAGETAEPDAGFVPSSCSDNDECWFGAGCFRGTCMDPAVLEGRYERTPMTNDWHLVSVSVDEGQLLWSNEAGAGWDLEFREGEIWAGEDCPYGAQALGLVGSRDAIEGLVFLGETYYRMD